MIYSRLCGHLNLWLLLQSLYDIRMNQIVDLLKCNDLHLYRPT